VLSLNKPVVRVRYDLQETDPEAFAVPLRRIMELARVKEPVAAR
jgi:hypothetical protein